MARTVIDTLIFQLGLGSKELDEKQDDAIETLRAMEIAQATTSENLREGTERLTKEFDQVGAMLAKYTAAGFVGSIVAKFITKTTAMTSELGNISRRIGMTAQDLYAWQRVTRELGGDAASVTGFLEALRHRMERFKSGVGGDVQFPSLLLALKTKKHPGGIPILDQNGNVREPEDVLMDLSEWGTQFTPATAAQTFREAGVPEDVIPVLLLGPERLRERLANAKGRAPTDAEIEKARSAVVEYNRAVQAVVAPLRTLAIDLLPIIGHALDAIDAALGGYKKEEPTKEAAARGKENRKMFYEELKARYAGNPIMLQWVERNFGPSSWGGDVSPTEPPVGVGAGGAERGGVSIEGVNPKLIDVVREGAKFALPPGYTYKWTSGVRPGDRGSYHSWGGAADLRIYTPEGRGLPNVGPNYDPLYDKLGLAVRAAQERMYPGENYIYGGHFRQGRTPYDAMHQQWGGNSRESFPRGAVGAEVQRQLQIIESQNAFNKGAPPLAITPPSLPPAQGKPLGLKPWPKESSEEMNSIIRGAEDYQWDINRERLSQRLAPGGIGWENWRRSENIEDYRDVIMPWWQKKLSEIAALRAHTATRLRGTRINRNYTIPEVTLPTPDPRRAAKEFSEMDWEKAHEWNNAPTDL